MPFGPASLLWELIPQTHSISKGMSCSTVCNSKKLETASMPFSRDEVAYSPLDPGNILQAIKRLRQLYIY
jgi:hypothetical protein